MSKLSGQEFWPNVWPLAKNCQAIMKSLLGNKFKKTVIDYYFLRNATILNSHMHKDLVIGHSCGLNWSGTTEVPWNYYNRKIFEFPGYIIWQNHIGICYLHGLPRPTTIKVSHNNCPKSDSKSDSQVTWGKSKL